MSWKKVRLDSICTMLSGNAWSASKFKDSGKIPIIRIQNLGNNENEKFIWWDDKYDNKFVIHAGDLLLSLSGSIKIDTWKGEDALLNQRIVKLIPNNGVDHRWFYWQINNIILEIEKMGKWALVNNVSVTDLKEIQIPLPPLPIQKRIAEILDAADALRRKDQELLRKYDELAQAIFIDMFGDPVKNEKGWEVKELDDVCSKITDGEHGTVERFENGKLYLMARNIRDNVFDLNDVDYVSQSQYELINKRCNPEVGDILLVCVGATIGRAAIVPEMEPFCLARSVALLKLDQQKILPFFLYSFIKSDFMQSKIQRAGNSSAQAGLYTGKIKCLPIYLPPLSLQIKYESLMKVLLEKKLKLNLSFTYSQNLFASLLQQAFKGELVK